MSTALAPKESDVLRACLDFLRLRGVFAWRCNTVGVWDPVKQVFRSRAGARGVSDILGVLPGGRFLAVECKRPGRKPSAEQAAFLANVVGAGGVALVVDDVRELAAELDRLRRAVGKGAAAVGGERA
jgi:hypothetical protein